MAKSTDIAKTEGNALPAFMNQGPARGSEQVTGDDLTIPQLSIVQSLSPVRQKNDPQYIEGADEGMIYNKLTGELYGDEVEVCPCMYMKEYSLWKERDAGGGFRGSFPTAEAAEEERTRLEDGDVCEVVETGVHYVLVKTDNGLTEAAIFMTKSALKASRKWNSLVRLNGGDRFSRMYRLSTIQQTNSKNQAYYNWSAASLSFVDEETYKRAEEIYEMVAAGQVRVSKDENKGEAPENTDY